MTYTKLALDAYKYNSFIDSSVYRLNSFYYVSLIFGLYNMPTFFSILSTYIYGVIFYILVLLLIKWRFKNLTSWIKQIIIIVFISLYVNTIWCLQVNWSTGSLFTLAIIVFATFLFNNNNIKNEDNLKIIYKYNIFIDAMMCFCLNFSLTGLLISILSLLVIKILFYVKYSNVQGIFLIPIIFAIILFSVSSSALHYKIHNTYYYLALYVISILIFIASHKFSKHMYFYPKKGTFIPKISEILFSSNLLKIKKNIYSFIKINLLILIFTIPIIMIVVKITTNITALEKHIDIPMFILFIIMINMCFFFNYYELLLIIIVMLITFSLFFVFATNTEFKNLTSGYADSRAIYSIMFVSAFFFTLFCLNYAKIPSKNKLFKIEALNPIIIFLGAFTPIIANSSDPVVNVFWYYSNFSVFDHKNIPFKNFQFAEKHENLLYDNNVFSSIMLPFTHLNPQLYIHNRLYHQNENISIPFFLYLTNYENKEKKVLNKMYYDVKYTNIYDVIILDVKNPLNTNQHINNTYRIIDKNGDMNLWIKK